MYMYTFIYIHIYSLQGKAKRYNHIYISQPYLIPFFLAFFHVLCLLSSFYLLILLSLLLLLLLLFFML